MVHLRGVIQIKYTSKPNSLISGIDTATILNLGDHGFADSFFFEKDYAKDLGKLSNQSEILEIINKLREPVRNMSDENKAQTMKYIQTLSKLSDLYSKM